MKRVRYRLQGSRFVVMLVDMWKCQVREEFTVQETCSYHAPEEGCGVVRVSVTVALDPISLEEYVEIDEVQT